MSEKVPQEIQEIEDILSELSGDYKVRIERLEPKWCDGSLGTLHISAGEKLDIEALGEQYGGRKYLLRFIGPSGKVLRAKTIKFPGKPREDGMEIKQPNAVQDATGIIQPSAPAPNPMEMMLPFLNALTSQANANQKTVETLMMGRIQNLETQLNSSHQNQNAPEQVSGIDQVRDSMSMIAEITKLQKQILPTEGETKPEEKSPIESALQDFMKMMMEREKTKMQMAVSQQTAQAVPPPPLEQPIVNATQTIDPVAQQLPIAPDPLSFLKSVPNDVFAGEVKRRFAGLSEDDQMDLIKVVAGDSIDFEQEEDEPSNETDLEPVVPFDSTGSIHGSDVALNLGGPPILSEDDETIKQSIDAADPSDTEDPLLNHT